jgi:hypothetical protein
VFKNNPKKQIENREKVKDKKENREKKTGEHSRSRPNGTADAVQAP